MVCIQCYLPPILFMIYMKFLQPIIAPYVEPWIERVIVYFKGPEAVQSACPIRPSSSKAKKAETTAGDSTSKPKEE